MDGRVAQVVASSSSHAHDRHRLLRSDSHCAFSVRRGLCWTETPVRVHVVGIGRRAAADCAKSAFLFGGCALFQVSQEPLGWNCMPGVVQG